LDLIHRFCFENVRTASVIVALVRQGRFLALGSGLEEPT